MFISFGHIVKAVLFAVGVWWCKEIFSRLPKDIQEFKSPEDNTARPVILFYWASALLAIYFVISFFLFLIRLVREGLMMR